MQYKLPMEHVREPCWTLGFDAEAVYAWKDATLAHTIDGLWSAAGCPPPVQAWWTACDDVYAFRWYINEPLAQMLDEAHVSWREFVIGKAEAIPPAARPYLRERAGSSERKQKRRVLRLVA